MERHVSSDEHDYIVVEFTVPGETRPRGAKMEVSNAGGYRDRQQLEIFYDPAKPSHVRTKGAENISHDKFEVLFWVVIIGLVVTVCAIAVLKGSSSDRKYP